MGRLTLRPSEDTLYLNIQTGSVVFQKSYPLQGWYSESEMPWTHDAFVQFRNGQEELTVDLEANTENEGTGITCITRDSEDQDTMMFVAKAKPEEVAAVHAFLQQLAAGTVPEPLSVTMTEPQMGGKRKRTRKQKRKYSRRH